jgi:hypothetical protein
MGRLHDPLQMLWAGLQTQYTFHCASSFRLSTPTLAASPP